MTRKILPDHVDEQGFEFFWQCYPRRDARKDAYKAWRQLQPSAELKERIHAALCWQIAAREWDDPSRRQFVPLPASWLRGERWTDEPTPPVPPLKPGDRRLSRVTESALRAVREANE